MLTPSLSSTEQFLIEDTLATHGGILFHIPHSPTVLHLLSSHKLYAQSIHRGKRHYSAITILQSAKYSYQIIRCIRRAVYRSIYVHTILIGICIYQHNCNIVQCAVCNYLKTEFCYQ